MPQPENTPAPRRRFLPPQSSSIRSTAPSSTRRNPFQSSRSTQVQPSSSFNTTPRFQSTPRVAAEDIQSSFDDETDTPLSRNGIAFSTRVPIDPLGEDDEPLSPLYGRAIETEEDHLLHIKGQFSPPQLRHGPLTYASKRRKTTHPNFDTAEPIATSLPLDDDHLEHYLDDESVGSLSDLNDYLALSTKPTLNEDFNRRFRPTTSDLVQPSPSSKKIFKPNAADTSPGQNVNGAVLPDIFSPSRRKGKKDYIPGGSADLVRSWILAIPAQESHSQELSEEILSIVDVRNDSSGRFAIATDDNGSQWLLPEQQEKAAISSRWTLSALCPGAQIRVKGRATRWGLNLDFQESNAVTVAAYWEVVSAG